MKLYINILFTIIFFINLQSSQIKIKNKTNKNIYVATYYKKSIPEFECYKHGKIVEVPIQEAIKSEEHTSVETFNVIENPVQKLLFSKKLIYSKNKKLLKQNISRYEYKFINKKSINSIYGNNFYLFEKNDIPLCLNYIEFKILNPVIGLFNKTTDFLINKLRKKIFGYKHENEIAKVRTGQNICNKEKIFLKERKKKVKENIEKLLNKKLSDNQVPNIAFCLTGGGYRSSIASMGTLTGAEEMGILDCSTYVSTLCGSSLPVISWLASKKTLQKYKKILKKSVSRAVITPITNLKLLRDIYERKFAFKQPFKVIDLFGFLFADKFLDNIPNKKQLEGISQQQKLLEHGEYPMPIYAAIDSVSNYEWLEFTPYEVGSYFLNAYIPTWSFGRRFVNGTSTDYAPEQTYSSFMGLFCSAYSIGAKDILNVFHNSNICKNGKKHLMFTKKIVQNSFLDEVRFFPSKIPNFTYAMDDSPMQNIKDFKVIDAGFELVIPIPPLLKKERKIDLIIIGDYSTSMNQLPKLEEYAKKLNAPFPKITTDDYKTKQISIFKDKQNPKAPVVIYIPFIKSEETFNVNDNFNPNFNPRNWNGFKICHNLRFTYNKDQFDLLFGLAKQNILDNKEKIINVIKEIVEKKSIRNNNKS